MSEAPSIGRSESSRQQRAALTVVTLPFLGFLVLGLGIVFGARGDDIVLLGLGLVTTLLALAPFSVDMLRPPENRHLLLSLFSLAFIWFFALPVFTIYLPAIWPVQPLGSSLVFPADIARAQIMAMLALASLLLGYALPFGHVAASWFPTPRHDWPLRTTLLVALLMLPFGWAINLASIYGVLPPTLGSGVIGALSLTIWFALALLLIAYLRHRSRSALVLMGSMILPTMLFFFFSDSKGKFLRPIFILMLTSWLYHRRIRGRWVVAGILGITLLYPAAQFYRYELAGGRTMAEMLRDPVGVAVGLGRHVAGYAPLEYLTAGLQMVAVRFDGLGRSSVIYKETPDRVPFQGGWTIAHIPMSYVPRVLWPEKPSLGIGQWITDTYGPGPHIRSSTGPTWMGELYLNWGTPGVIGGMLAIGLLLRLLHEGLLRSRTTPALLAGVIVLYETAPTLEGGLVPSLPSVAFDLAPLFATHVVLRLFGFTRVDPGAESPVEASSQPVFPTESSVPTRHA